MMKIDGKYITIETGFGSYEYDIRIEDLSSMDWPAHMRAKAWWTSTHDAQFVRLLTWIKNETNYLPA